MSSMIRDLWTNIKNLVLPPKLRKCAFCHWPITLGHPGIRTRSDQWVHYICPKERP